MKWASRSHEQSLVALEGREDDADLEQKLKSKLGKYKYCA